MGGADKQRSRDGAGAVMPPSGTGTRQSLRPVAGSSPQSPLTPLDAMRTAWRDRWRPAPGCEPARPAGHMRRFAPERELGRADGFVVHPDPRAAPGVESEDAAQRSSRRRRLCRRAGRRPPASCRRRGSEARHPGICSASAERSTGVQRSAPSSVVGDDVTVRVRHVDRPRRRTRDPHARRSPCPAPGCGAPSRPACPWRGRSEELVGAVRDEEHRAARAHR